MEPDNKEKRMETESKDLDNKEERKMSGEKKKKKTAYRRMIEHRIKIASIIVGVIALLAILFFTLVASYSFSEKAWHVKFDPIHGYSYILYTKQEFSPAHIVITSCSLKDKEITVPDTIWGVLVDELEDNAFPKEGQIIHLGQYVTVVGEGYGDKLLILPSGYENSYSYLSIKDRNGSGFYYKVTKYGALAAYAFFGTQEQYQIPKSCCGLPVSLVTEYYENDAYLEALAEVEAETSSIPAYNMLRVDEVRKNGIDPYVMTMKYKASLENIQTRLMRLPDEFTFLADGSPADGETAIKMAIINTGTVSGESCGDVMAKYTPMEFIRAESFITQRTNDCHDTDELSFQEWLCDGLIEVPY